VPRYRIVGVWFSKSVVLCAAMGEMLRRTASAERKQHTSDVMSVLQCVLQCVAVCCSADSTQVM